MAKCQEWAAEDSVAIIAREIAKRASTGGAGGKPALSLSELMFIYEEMIEGTEVTTHPPTHPTQPNPTPTQSSISFRPPTYSPIPFYITTHPPTHPYRATPSLRP